MFHCETAPGLEVNDQNAQSCCQKPKSSTHGLVRDQRPLGGGAELLLTRMKEKTGLLDAPGHAANCAGAINVGAI